MQIFGSTANIAYAPETKLIYERTFQSNIMSSAKPQSYGAVPTTDAGLDRDRAPVKKKKCNDVFFALLFLAHIGYIGYAWVASSSTGVEEGSGGTDMLPTSVTNKFTEKGVVKFVAAITGAALLLSSLAIIFMTTFSDELIEVALAAPILGFLAVGGYGIYISKVWMMVTGGVGFLVFVILACMVRNKIDVSASGHLICIISITSLLYFLRECLTLVPVCCRKSSHGFDRGAYQLWFDCRVFSFGNRRVWMDRSLVWCYWLGHERHGLENCVLVFTFILLDAPSH